MAQLVRSLSGRLREVQLDGLVAGAGEWPVILVGVAGFEPAASSSRTKRAAKLRYTPSLAPNVGAGRTSDSLAETRTRSGLAAHQKPAGRGQPGRFSWNRVTPG
jgi:hypothetical protein